MAAVLDALAPYVKKLIADMAQEEVSMLLGVSSDITKLEDNMESLNDFLADAERKRITEDKSVRRWVGKLKNAMYDATDILDLCQLEADKRKESKGGSIEEKASGCCQSLIFCLRNPVFAHKIGSRIKELNQRLENIYKEGRKLKLTNLGSYPPQRMPADDGEHPGRNMTSEIVESAIVGEKIEKDTKELSQLLISNDYHDIKVVSIVGTGGIGKTTLAQKIFNDTTIQEHFKTRIWLSITQHFNEAELLRAAISHAGGHHGGEPNKSLLTTILTDTLSTGRFLVVLDDVWTDEAWNHVLSGPIRNASRKQPGNWVLISTRKGDLAQRMGASFYQHHVSPLDQEDAWSLLKKQLPLTPNNQGARIEHLRGVGMKIINKCAGLPLAIKVMGGLLSMKNQSEREWEAVLNHHAWSIDGLLPTELDKRLYLSYEDLTPQLKQCFLYCSLFPKGTIIRRRKVILMWISEGFIQPDDGSSSGDDQLEEVATEYYQELIKRNLIEPKREYSTAYSCTMHDVVRSFAEFLAREESLVVQDEQAAGRSRHSNVRRLSIGSTKSVQEEWDTLQKQKAIRTLIINCRINIKNCDSLSSLCSLRVLSIRGADFDGTVDSLCRLRHLRYLNLENTNISRLPEDIHRMKLLQHLVLDGSTNLDHLPRCITQLVHLRTLSMTSSPVRVIPKGFRGLTNLRTLLGFPTHMSMDGDRGWCSLEEIGPLSQLRYLTLHGLENVSSSTLAEKAKVSSKEHLVYLKLQWNRSRSMGSGDGIEKYKNQHAVEEVFDKFCPPPCIEHLLIEGYFGRQLLNWTMVPATMSFKSMRYLTLKGLPCCTQLPDGLCRLPCLESLDIEEAPAIKRVGPEFQASTVAASGGVTAISAAFPNMTNLHLEGLCEWEEWDWEEWDWEEQGEDVTAEAMAMPVLKTLEIRNCMLSCLPPGLASTKRHALRELYLYELANLIYVENFPSVVKLEVSCCPELKRIKGLPMSQKIMIARCPDVEVLQGVPALDSLELEDATMETLPDYLTAINPRYLELRCSKKLQESLSHGSSELSKISHIRKHRIDYIKDSDTDSRKYSDEV